VLCEEATGNILLSGGDKYYTLWKEFTEKLVYTFLLKAAQLCPVITQTFGSMNF
jgi:hypothetical protein